MLNCTAVTPPPWSSNLTRASACARGGHNDHARPAAAVVERRVLLMGLRRDLCMCSTASGRLRGHMLGGRRHTSEMEMRPSPRPCKASRAASSAALSRLRPSGVFSYVIAAVMTGPTTLDGGSVRFF